MIPGTIILLSGSSIAENSPSGSVVGALSVSEPGSFSFVLLNNAGGLFSIDAGNQLIVSGPLDHEQAAFQTIVAQGFSPILGTIEETFLISIEDVAGRTVKLSGDYGRFIGSLEGDSIVGSAYGGKIAGRGGNDTIEGGNGHDILIGGCGQDDLRGDAGADIFVFRYVGGSTVAAPDHIRDFRSHQGDKIDLRGIEARSLGGDDFDFIGNAGFGGSEGELRFDPTTHLLQGDIDGDGTADFAIQINVGHLGRGDFLL